MSQSNRKKDCSVEEDAGKCIVPAGLPDWITSELIQKTISVWQPYYATPITIDEAVGMIHSVGMLVDALSMGVKCQT